MRFLMFTALLSGALLGSAWGQAAPQVVLLPREELTPNTMTAAQLPPRLKNPSLKRFTYIGSQIRLEVAQALLEQFMAKKDVQVVCGGCAGAIFADLRRFGVPMYAVSNLDAQAMLLTDAGMYTGGILNGSSAPGFAFESVSASQGYAKVFDLILSKARRW